MSNKKMCLLGAGLVLVAVVYSAVLYGISARDTDKLRAYEQKIFELQLLIKNQPTEHENNIITKTASASATTTVAPIIKRLKPRLDPSIIQSIDKAIVKYSGQYQIPPEFVVYLMDRESDFRLKAISSVGAIGLMQIFPKYHGDKMEELGISYLEVYEIDHNIHLGCWILREYLDQTGSIDKALTRYVGGKHPTYVTDILSGFANEMIVR